MANGAFIRRLRATINIRATAISLVLIAIMALLLVGVSRSGMVTSLSGEGRIERSHDSNRLILTEDKDGCLDMRTLGRSNGVYMSIKPCHPGDKDKDKSQPPAATPNPPAKPPQ
jgi:hypothetical protein